MIATGRGIHAEGHFFSAGHFQLVRMEFSLLPLFLLSFIFLSSLFSGVLSYRYCIVFLSLFVLFSKKKT